MATEKILKHCDLHLITYDANVENNNEVLCTAVYDYRTIHPPCSAVQASLELVKRYFYWGILPYIQSLMEHFIICCLPYFYKIQQYKTFVCLYMTLEAYKRTGEALSTSIESLLGLCTQWSCNPHMCMSPNLPNFVPEVRQYVWVSGCHSYFGPWEHSNFFLFPYHNSKSCNFFILCTCSHSCIWAYLFCWRHFWKAAFWNKCTEYIMYWKTFYISNLFFLGGTAVLQLFEFCLLGLVTMAFTVWCKC